MEKSLQSFFGKYKNLAIPNESIRKAFAESIKEVVGASVDISDIVFRQGNIYLTSDPYLKNEVLLNRKEISLLMEKKISKKPKKII